MRHLFIINPAAGKENRTVELKGQIARAMQGREEPCEIYVTKGPRDATEKILSEAASGDKLRVYACGGDGTLNECVCGAAERPNVSVTHYPCGTGNDFIKAFGDERQRFFTLEELIEGETRPIDVIRVGDRYSVNICSVGIDARIGCNVHKYSRLGGAGGYIVSTAVEVVKGVSTPMRAEIDGAVVEGKETLICVCNGTSYGGFFRPVPEARVDDGALDVLVAGKVSRLTFAKLVGVYAKGGYRKMPKVITRYQACRAVIEAAEEFSVNLDGEELRTARAEMTLVPKGLRFTFPRGMRYFENEMEKQAE